MLLLYLFHAVLRGFRRLVETPQHSSWILCPYLTGVSFCFVARWKENDNEGIYGMYEEEGEGGKRKRKNENQEWNK